MKVEHTARKNARRTRRWLIAAVAAVVAVGFVAALAGGAFADQVANNLDTTIDSAPESMTLTVGGSNGSVGYILHATTGNDSKSGCNLTGNGSDLVVDLTSSNTAAATLGSSQITIPACDSATPVTVSVHPVAAGSSTITATFHSVTTSSPATSPSDYDMTTATFTVTVNNPPPTNHAPTTPGAPTVPAGTSPRADGNFTLNWTASTDQDAGDTVSYTLEQHDASSSTWTPVASGLSANSYTFGSGGNPAEAEGTWTYRVKAVDDHGAESDYAESDNLVKVDESAPNAPTAHATPVAAYNDGANDWYKDSVSVSFTGNGDPALQDTSAGSGVASVTGSQLFDSSNVGSDGSFSITGHATDNVGNTSAGTTVSGYLDWQSPTVSITPTTSADYTDGSGNSWWKDSVDLSVGASDPAPSSGLASDPSTSLGPYTTSGSVAAGTYTATDNVGHSGSNSSFQYFVDSQAPSTNASAVLHGTSTSYTPGTWTNTPVDVTLTATDPGTGDTPATGSGVKQIDYSTNGGSSWNTLDNGGTIALATEGTTTITYHAEDNVGHAESDQTFTVQIDETPPTVDCTAPTPDYASDGGWFKANQSVPCTASDDLSGLADSGDMSFSLGPTTIADDSYGSQTLGPRDVFDNAGNSASTGSFPLQIDRQAPVISDLGSTDTPSGNDGSNDWFNYDVTVNFSAIDGGSGVACTSPWPETTTGEGSNVTVSSGDCADNVGNADNAIDSSGYHIDETDPVVSVTGVSNGATYTLGSVPTAGCSTTDALSGVHTEAALSTSGGPIGTITATCDGAEDNAGNTNSASVTYSVVYNFTGFFQPVNNLTDAQPWNSAKAGSAIPVKFNLGGYQGLSIFNPGFPKVTQTVCPNGGTVADPIEAYAVTAGGSSLAYDFTALQYVYVWKTDKSWAGKCFLFQLGLSDGTPHNFQVQFTK